MLFFTLHHPLRIESFPAFVLSRNNNKATISRPSPTSPTTRNPALTSYPPPRLPRHSLTHSHPPRCAFSSIHYFSTSLTTAVQTKLKRQLQNQTCFCKETAVSLSDRPLALKLVTLLRAKLGLNSLKGCNHSFWDMLPGNSVGNLFS